MDEKMVSTDCQHQLAFAPWLDDAANCARCGAIVVIENREGADRGAHIVWLSEEQQEGRDFAAED